MTTVLGQIGMFLTRKSVLVAISMLALTDIANAAATITRTSSFDYETASGLLIKEVVEPTNSNYCVVTAYSLDAYGNRQSTTTRNCAGAAASVPGGQQEAAAPVGSAVFSPRTSSETYGGDKRFPTSSQNALFHTETKVFNGRFGLPTSLTGPNQLTTTWAYDGFGRKVAERLPDGTGTRWDYRHCQDLPGGTDATCPSVGGAVAAYSITATPLMAPVDIANPGAATPNGPYSKAYHDSLGRIIRTVTQGFDGQLILQDTVYNARGEVAQKSKPFYSGAGAVWTSYLYDTLGRVIQTSEPTSAGQATDTIDYNGLTKTHTDALLNSTVEVRDVAGQVISVTDAKGGTLTRAYDPLGNLVRTVDAKGNVTSVVYDSRGRKTALYDPDMGVWTYAYNALGELIQQVNPKAQTASMTYDVLGRMKTRSEPSLNSTWTYDVCTKGVGKLCTAAGNNGYNRTASYDNLGRPSTSTTTVSAASFTSSVTYDALTGRIKTKVYPSGITIQNNYTSLGYLSNVVDTRTGGNLWTAQTYDAAGRPLQYSHGNGVVTNNEYYIEGTLNTTRSGPSGSVQTLGHSYDLEGKLKSRVDYLTGVAANYDYDQLGRLKSEARSGGGVNPAQAITWDYDSIGNLTQRSEAGRLNTYNYPSSGTGSFRPHAVASVSGYVNGYGVPIYAYDANGNMISGAGKTLVWNSFDKVQQINRAPGTLNYLYDAEQERAQESYYVNGVLQRQTFYLNPAAGSGLFYEYETGPSGVKHKHYISAGRATVAMITCTASPCTSVSNSTTQYWHTDHLGSVSVVTNQAGSAIERLAYEPFGKRRNSNGVTDPASTLAGASTDRGYTGHEHMDEVGLINMNGRIYDPGLGRFMSADPIIQSPTSLQSFNRYAYAWNSPLNGTDPSGYSKISTTWKSVWRSEVFHAVVTVVLAANGYPGYAAAYSGARTHYETGSFNQGLKASALTYASVYIANSIGTHYNGAAYPLENTLLHAASGCVLTAAGGGNCASGALAGGAGAALSNYYQSSTSGLTRGENLVLHAVVGGTASVLGGGKFGNGAITSAFGYLFNDQQHIAGKKPTSPITTGDPYIDSTLKNLNDLALQALSTSGDGRGPVFGTRVHFEFTTLVNGLGRKDLFTERSFDFSGLVAYGTDGSIRTDVILGKDPTKPVAIFDLKTGSARLTQARADQIRARFPGFKGPIIGIYPQVCAKPPC